MNWRDYFQEQAGSNEWKSDVRDVWYRLSKVAGTGTSVELAESYIYLKRMAPLAPHEVDVDLAGELMHAIGEEMKLDMDLVAVTLRTLKPGRSIDQPKARRNYLYRVARAHKLKIKIAKSTNDRRTITVTRL